ncbi:MAG: cell division protein ZapA [Geminicoccaceae bacterium]|nr:MAG: cell division protein ZapA [Geminicoccaceae bacterium]
MLPPAWTRPSPKSICCWRIEATMATVEIRIQGKAHTLHCDDGQEQRLRQVAQYLDRRLTDASKASGVPNDARILVLTSILIADELADARDEIDGLKRRIDDVEARAASALERVAKRIEDVASQLETT